MAFPVAHSLMRCGKAIRIKTCVRQGRHSTIRAVIINEEGHAGGFLLYVEDRQTEEGNFYFACCLTDALALEEQLLGGAGLETRG